jgi:hypothetical protein
VISGSSGIRTRAFRKLSIRNHREREVIERRKWLLLLTRRSLRSCLRESATDEKGKKGILFNPFCCTAAAAVHTFLSTLVPTLRISCLSRKSQFLMVSE